MYFEEKPNPLLQYLFSTCRDKPILTSHIVFLPLFFPFCNDLTLLHSIFPLSSSCLPFLFTFSLFSFCFFGALTLRPLTFRPPVPFFSVSAFLLTRRGLCRSEAPSTAWAAPGDHEPLIGRARWQSMGELRLGRSVTCSVCGWTYRQGTVFFSHVFPPDDISRLLLPLHKYHFDKLGKIFVFATEYVYLH